MAFEKVRSLFDSSTYHIERVGPNRRTDLKSKAERSRGEFRRIRPYNTTVGPHYAKKLITSFHDEDAVHSPLKQRLGMAQQPPVYSFEIWYDRSKTRFGFYLPSGNHVSQFTKSVESLHPNCSINPYDQFPEIHPNQFVTGCRFQLSDAKYAPLRNFDSHDPFQSDPYEALIAEIEGYEAETVIVQITFTPAGEGWTNGWNFFDWSTEKWVRHLNAGRIVWEPKKVRLDNEDTHPVDQMKAEYISNVEGRMGFYANIRAFVFSPNEEDARQHMDRIASALSSTYYNDDIKQSLSKIPIPESQLDDELIKTATRQWEYDGTAFTHQELAALAHLPDEKAISVYTDQATTAFGQRPPGDSSEKNKDDRTKTTENDHFGPTREYTVPDQDDLGNSTADISILKPLRNLLPWFSNSTVRDQTELSEPTGSGHIPEGAPNEIKEATSQQAFKQIEQKYHEGEINADDIRAQFPDQADNVLNVIATRAKARTNPEKSDARNDTRQADTQSTTSLDVSTLLSSKLSFDLAKITGTGSSTDHSDKPEYQSDTSTINDIELDLDQELEEIDFDGKKESTSHIEPIDPDAETDFNKNGRRSENLPTPAQEPSEQEDSEDLLDDENLPIVSGKFQFEKEYAEYTQSLDSQTGNLVNIEHKVHSKSGNVYSGEDVRELFFEDHYDNPDDPLWLGYQSRGENPFREIPFEKFGWFRHMSIFGTTGTGKSTFQNNLALQIAFKRYGFLYIDPKGDGVDDLLKQLPEHRLDDVIYIEPGSEEFNEVVGMNFLQPSVPPSHPRYDKEVESIVADLTSVLKAGEYWGPKMAGITKNITRGLIRSKNPYNLYDMYYVLMDEDSRRLFARSLEREDFGEDSAVSTTQIITDIKQYSEQIANMDEEEVDPVKRRIQDWVENPISKEIVAHRESTFSIDDAIENNRIILVKNTIDSEDIKRVIATAIMRRVWAAIKARADTTKKDERNPFFAIIDEFDDVVSDDMNMEQMLSKARSGRLGVILATQNPSLIEDKAPQVLTQMFSNVETMVSFAVRERNDADLISDRFGEDIAFDQLVAMPAFHCMTRFAYYSQEDGIAVSDPVDMDTFPEYPPLRTDEDVEEVITSSLDTFGGEPPTETFSDTEMLLAGAGMQEFAVAAFLQAVWCEQLRTRSDAVDVRDIAASFNRRTDMELTELPNGIGIPEDLIEVTNVELDTTDTDQLPDDYELGTQDYKSAWKDHGRIFIQDYDVAVAITKEGIRSILERDSGRFQTSDQHQDLLREALRWFSLLGIDVNILRQKSHISVPDGEGLLPIGEIHDLREAEKLRREFEQKHPAGADITQLGDVSIEAETSTQRKPARTIENLARAFKKGRKAIFFVQDGRVENEAFEYNARRVEQIFTDPPFYSRELPILPGENPDSTDSREHGAVKLLYNREERHELGDPLDNNEKYPVVPKGTRIFWIDTGDKLRLYDGLTEDATRLADIRRTETDFASANAFKYWCRKDVYEDEWIVYTGMGQPQRYPTQAEMRQEWQFVRKPLLPERAFEDHSIPSKASTNTDLPTRDDWEIVIVPSTVHLINDSEDTDSLKHPDEIDMTFPPECVPVVYDDGDRKPLIPERYHDQLLDEPLTEVIDTTTTKDASWSQISAADPAQTPALKNTESAATGQGHGDLSEESKHTTDRDYRADQTPTREELEPVVGDESSTAAIVGDASEMGHTEPQSEWQFSDNKSSSTPEEHGHSESELTQTTTAMPETEPISSDTDKRTPVDDDPYYENVGEYQYGLNSPHLQTTYREEAPPNVLKKRKELSDEYGDDGPAFFPFWKAIWFDNNYDFNDYIHKGMLPGAIQSAHGIRRDLIDGLVEDAKELGYLIEFDAPTWDGDKADDEAVDRALRLPHPVEKPYYYLKDPARYARREIWAAIWKEVDQHYSVPIKAAYLVNIIEATDSLQNITEAVAAVAIGHYHDLLIPTWEGYELIPPKRHPEWCDIWDRVGEDYDHPIERRMLRGITAAYFNEPLSAADTRIQDAVGRNILLSPDPDLKDQFIINDPHDPQTPEIIHPLPSQEANTTIPESSTGDPNDAQSVPKTKTGESSDTDQQSTAEPSVDDVNTFTAYSNAAEDDNGENEDDTGLDGSDGADADDVDASRSTGQQNLKQDSDSIDRPATTQDTESDSETAVWDSATAGDQNQDTADNEDEALAEKTNSTDPSQNESTLYAAQSSVPVPPKIGSSMTDDNPINTFTSDPAQSVDDDGAADDDYGVDLDEELINDHYDAISPVIHEAAETTSVPAVSTGRYETMIVADFMKWYQTTANPASDPSQDPPVGPDAPDTEYALKRRPIGATEYDDNPFTIDRSLYLLTTYKDPESIRRWTLSNKVEERVTDEDTDTGQQAETSVYYEYQDGDNPTPDESDIRTIVPWGDIDLADDLKPHRGNLSEGQRTLIERTLEAYVDGYADLVGGSTEPVFVLDSVGGAYIMLAPSVVTPFFDALRATDRITIDIEYDSEYDIDLSTVDRSLDDDAIAKLANAVFDALNRELHKIEQRVNDKIDGASETIQPDWVNNRNRQYKAPLSIHKKHPGVVTPIDPDNISYEMTHVEDVNGDVIDEAVEWADRFTSIEFADYGVELLQTLFPNHWDATGGDPMKTTYRIIFEARIKELEQQAKREHHQRQVQELDFDPDSTTYNITPNISDVNNAAQQISVAEIVKKYASDAYATGIDTAEKTEFNPAWRPSTSGSSCFVNHQKNTFADSGMAAGGGPVKAIALGLSINGYDDPNDSLGRTYFDALEKLRQEGYDLPVWIPGKGSAHARGRGTYDKTPSWALKKAARIFEIADKSDFVTRENEDGSTWTHLSGEDYKEVIRILKEEGIDHGHDYSPTDDSGLDEIKSMTTGIPIGGAAIARLGGPDTIATTYETYVPVEETDDDDTRSNQIFDQFVTQFLEADEDNDPDQSDYRVQKDAVFNAYRTWLKINSVKDKRKGENLSGGVHKRRITSYLDRRFNIAVGRYRFEGKLKGGYKGIKLNETGQKLREALSE